jgi:type-F conjugative transfer system pilin assembly thiol-disulfide isomerase TrbB
MRIYFFRVLVLLMIFVSTLCYANKALDEISTLEAQKKQKEQSRPVLKTKNVVDALSGEYEFILFYRSTCPHCKIFDPTLKTFSMRHHIVVRAYTTDGISLPSFPDSRPVDLNLIHQYFGDSTDIAVPVLFLMHMTNGHTFPVSYGEMNESDLENRMNELMPKVWRYEGNERSEEDHG